MIKRRLRAPFFCGAFCFGQRMTTMHIDGQCHCGEITFEAEIDPETVSVCHCTDCQTLTGSPFRVTAVCSGAEVRLTAQDLRQARRQRPDALPALLRRLRFPAVHERRRRPGGRLGHPLGQHPPARQIAARQADLVPVGGGVDRRGAAAAGPATGLRPWNWRSALARSGPVGIKKRRGAVSSAG